jgi:hypothetical protein
MDREWWQTYRAELDSVFVGDRFSNNSHAGNYRTTRISQNCYANSGAGAIVTAALGGASKIILLGYDCQKTGGKSHWHGDHPKHLGNASRIDGWKQKFSELSKYYAKIEILNASRETALECFPRVELEDALWQT